MRRGLTKKRGGNGRPEVEIGDEWSSRELVGISGYRGER